LIKEKYITSLSKTLSYILRHNPEDFELKMKIDGTIKLKDLIEALKEDNRFNNIELRDIKELAASDKKNRFSIVDSKNGKSIKANYGHSIKWINLDYEEIIPPRYLYHGTTNEVYQKILKDGIKKMGRNYVHLSKNKKQARRVGERRTESPIILKILAKQMYEDGKSFFKTNSEIILTEYVNPKYIEI